MDIIYKKPLKQNSPTILRKAGYIPIRDRKSGKESFVLKIRGDRYPRFHLYVEEEAEERTKWHLHLDNKEHGWGSKRHDADYDSPEVKSETERLIRWMKHFTQAKEDTPPKNDQDKPIGVLAKLFG